VDIFSFRYTSFTIILTHSGDIYQFFTEDSMDCMCLGHAAMIVVCFKVHYVKLINYRAMSIME